MNKKEILSILTLLILVGNVFETSASIKPIIVSDMPNPLNSGLQAIQLRWTIIDDNPRYYVITINNSIWKNESLQSNIIDETFSNAVGWYNVSLHVFDFSNNYAYSNLNINISPVYPTTASATTSEQPSSTNPVNQRNASPGFELPTVITLFSLISFIVLRKRKKKKYK